jgi:hypothetical protein
LEQTAASASDRPVTPVFGAAVPIKVSLPAQPVFVDRSLRGNLGSVGQ